MKRVRLSLSHDDAKSLVEALDKLRQFRDRQAAEQIKRTPESMEHVRPYFAVIEREHGLQQRIIKAESVFRAKPRK